MKTEWTNETSPVQHRLRQTIRAALISSPDRNDVTGQPAAYTRHIIARTRHIGKRSVDIIIAIPLMFLLLPLAYSLGQDRPARLGRLSYSLRNHHVGCLYCQGAATTRRLFWRLSGGISEAGKRLVDISVSTLMLVVLLPLFILVALAIRLESSGPAFFSQTRVGRHGQTFTMWKFRSMYCDAEARKGALKALNEMQGGIIFKMKNDPRITRVGRIIRRLSIDELPQIWNVLKGDMSLVGPRPALPSEVCQYSLEQRDRLDTRPGITCTWQVTGRSEIPFDEQVMLDIDYIRQQSVRTDLKLLAKTVPAVISGRGAY